MVEAGELDVEIKEFLVFAICGAIRAVRLALPIQSCCLGFERLFPYLHHLLVYQSVEPVISWQVAHLLPFAKVEREHGRSLASSASLPAFPSQRLARPWYPQPPRLFYLFAPAVLPMAL